MTAPTNKASFYADFGSLSALKRDAKVDSQKTLRAAAQQFESLFTDMMLKSMRSATSSIGDSLTGSSELDTYQGMFDQQLSVQLSKGKGLGLADMLVQQLTRSGMVGQSKSANASSANATTDATAVDSASATKASDKSGSDSAQPIASTTAWPPATKQEFVQALLPHAQAAAEKLGVDASTLVAHAALETGWGKHMPCNADGSTSFNLFGIKASAKSPSTSATTLEYEQGVAVKRVARFKTYDSPAECFGDYANLLSGNRYANARNSDDNASQFAQGLQQGGYATDPHYANKLRAMVGAVRSIQAATAASGSQIAATQVPSTSADT